jgi:hypothetical protein
MIDKVLLCGGALLEFGREEEVFENLLGGLVRLGLEEEEGNDAEILARE